MRKYWFWSILGSLFFLSALFLIVRGFKDDEESPGTPRIIRAGIGGAINHPGVYSIPEGSDLAMLIRRARGLAPNADIEKIDFDKTVLNDSVFCIPRKPAIRLTLPDSVPVDIVTSFEHAISIPVPDTGSATLKELNFLYIGFPAVYVIINYIPEIRQLNFLHIPHRTVLMQNDYQLIDIFFTLGIESTIQILQRQLNIEIDYYMMQDRFSFIEMIDLLGGVIVNLDQPFAEEYNFRPRPTKLNGFHTWEYIRFLDFMNLRKQVSSSTNLDLIYEDNFTISPADRQRAYEMRQHRQRLVMQAMRESYKQLPKAEQILKLGKLLKTFETNLGIEIVTDLYEDILVTPNLSYGNLPGYYKAEGENICYYPDFSAYRTLRDQQIREYLQQSDTRKRTTY